jgi:hypothetical protein
VLFIGPKNSSGSILRLDVRTNPPTGISRSETFMEVWDMDVSSDGQWIYHAGRFPRIGQSGGNYGVRRLSTSDLVTGETRWVTGAFPDSISLHPDDSRFAISLGGYAVDIWDDRSYSNHQWRWKYAEVDDSTFRRAVQWSDDGSRIFAVAGEQYLYDPHVVNLHVTDPSQT